MFILRRKSYELESEKERVDFVINITVEKGAKRKEEESPLGEGRRGWQGQTQKGGNNPMIPTRNSEDIVEK